MRKRKLWTLQSELVVSILQEKGIVQVKQEFLRQKYEDTAWIFQTAYRFLSQKMEQKIPRPKGSESPFWLFCDPKWAGNAGENCLLQCLIPEEEVLLFDLRKWSQVLNLSYVGSEQKQEEFRQKLYRQGVKDPLELFRTPLYPLLKQEVIKSWDDILCIDGVEEQYLQGACWQLKKEWLL